MLSVRRFRTVRPRMPPRIRGKEQARDLVKVRVKEEVKESRVKDSERGIKDVRGEICRKQRRSQRSVGL